MPYVSLNIHGPGQQQDKKLKESVDLLERAAVRLLRMAEQQMKEIVDHVAAQAAFHARMEASLASIEAKVSRLISEPSGITLEDLQALDKAKAASESLAARVEALDATIPAGPTVQ